MQVTVRLHGALNRYLPSGSVANAAKINIGEDTTPQSALSSLSMPKRHCYMMLINDVFLAPSECGVRRLKANDTLIVWQAIAAA